MIRKPHTTGKVRRQIESINSSGRLIIFVLIFAIVGLCAFAYQNRDLGSVPAPPPATPKLSDYDQAKIRKMQLDDARISNAIQSRQLEIIELQKRRDQNAAEYQKFVAGVCGKDFVFSQENDELKCVAKEKKQ